MLQIRKEEHQKQKLRQQRGNSSTKKHGQDIGSDVSWVKSSVKRADFTNSRTYDSLHNSTRTNMGVSLIVWCYERALLKSCYKTPVGIPIYKVSNFKGHQYIGTGRGARHGNVV